MRTSITGKDIGKFSIYKGTTDPMAPLLIYLCSRLDKYKAGKVCSDTHFAPNFVYFF